MIEPTKLDLSFSIATSNLKLDNYTYTTNGDTYSPMTLETFKKLQKKFIEHAADRMLGTSMSNFMNHHPMHVPHYYNYEDRSGRGELPRELVDIAFKIARELNDHKPKVSEKEINAIRDEAFQKGYDEGYNEAITELENNDEI